MSLLIFVMPGMFAKRKDQLKKMFSLFPKNQDDSERSKYEADRIAHAKRIMKPFFLRRLKDEVICLLSHSDHGKCCCVMSCNFCLCNTLIFCKL